MIIHIVEDDPGVNESLRFLLQALGHSVVAHTNALTLFAAPLPAGGDLVIVDLGLPDVDGASVIRWLRKLSTPPRVLAISGQSQKLIDRAVKGIKSLQVLRKPLNGNSLVSYLT